MSDDDTGQAGNAEPSQALGTEGKPEAKADGSQALSQQLEAERKARQQVEMERNQLRNKLEEDEKKRLEEDGKYRELAELERKKREEMESQLETDKQDREARKFRDQIIAQQPDEVQKLAKALISANEYNLLWKDGASKEEAERELTDQLSALATAAGIDSDPANKQPRVDENNPNPRNTRSQGKPAPKNAQEELANMREDLERRMQGQGF